MSCSMMFTVRSVEVKEGPVQVWRCFQLDIILCFCLELQRPHTPISLEQNQLNTGKLETVLNWSSSEQSHSVIDYKHYLKGQYAEVM